MFWYKKRISQLESIVSTMKQQIDILRIQSVIQWTNCKLYFGENISYFGWPLYIIYTEEWDKDYVIEWNPVSLVCKSQDAEDLIKSLGYVLLPKSIKEKVKKL